MHVLFQTTFMLHAVFPLNLFFLQSRSAAEASLEHLVWVIQNLVHRSTFFREGVCLRGTHMVRIVPASWSLLGSRLLP
jgi:hypothetical protein